MRKKETIDYIYCTAQKEKWQWNVVREHDLCMLHIEFGNLTSGKRKRTMRKLLRRFCMKDVVIGADAQAAERLEITGQMFAAKQAEFLRNQDYITERLSEQIRQTQKERSSLLIVIEDPHWGRREFVQCILAAKDYFRDIAIWTIGAIRNVENILADIYEEWGLAIEILGAEQVKSRHFQMAFLFVDKRNASVQTCCSYDVAYLVGDATQRERTQCIDGKGRIYAGLRYQINGRSIRGDYARNLAFQRPEVYQKKGVSIVAICEAE